ncbi:MAG: T9SS type A sorting domain-containing protein [Saprospiraceae bacterium]
MQSNTDNKLYYLILALILTSAVQAQYSAEFLQILDQEPTTTSLRNNAPDTALSTILLDTLYYEDFSDGDAGWTYVNTNPDSFAVWRYETDPEIYPTVHCRYPNFESPSAQNGFMWFDYLKFLDDTDTNIGQPPYPHLIGSLTSPLLDWSAFETDKPHELQFFSFQPTFDIRNSRVEIRCPGLADAVVWSSIDERIRPNATVLRNEQVRIPERFIGQDSVQIVFVYDGDFYGWIIDDIVVSKLPAIELQTNLSIGIAPNYSTPAIFAAGTSMPFIADIQNNGFITSNIQLAITIADSNDTVIYTDTLLYAGLALDSIAENLVFPTTVPMPTTIGNYTGTYEIFTDRINEDSEPENNAQSFTFNITNRIFSKGTFWSGVRPAGGDIEYAFTNLYYTPNLLADSLLRIDSVSFGVFAQRFLGDDEATVVLKTYGFRGDINGDNIAQYGDVDNTNAELVELAARSFIIDTALSEISSGTPVTYTPSDDGAVVLANDANYVGFGVAITYTPGQGGTNDDNMCFLGNTANDYAAFTQAAAAAGLPDSLSSILTIGGVATYGFFEESSPFIQAEISYDIVNSVNESLMTEAAFSIHPNPATTQFEINFNFGATADAQFEIINAVGQTISAFNRDGLTSGAITIPTQGMNNGLYYVKVRTNDGQTASRKLLLAR